MSDGQDWEVIGKPSKLHPIGIGYLIGQCLYCGSHATSVCYGQTELGYHFPIPVCDLHLDYHVNVLKHKTRKGEAVLTTLFNIMRGKQNA